MLGKIKFYDSKKGFGFIVREDEQPDLFFHISGVMGDKKELKEGDPVTFDLAETERGLKAINIMVR
jgi:CspA family cold shock protein